MLLELDEREEEKKMLGSRKLIKNFPLEHFAEMELRFFSIPLVKFDNI